MSYLLDALKKAQLERESLQSTNVQPEQMPVKSQAMPVWLVGMVVLFIVFSLYQFLPTEYAEPISSNAQNKAVNSVASNGFEKNLPVKTQISEQSQVSPAKEIVVERAVKALELTELPAHVLRKIPSLSLQSHIYSPDPQYRSVIINDASFKQNMFIEEQVILDEITSQGVNIKVADYLIFLPKGISWVATKRAE